MENRLDNFFDIKSPASTEDLILREIKKFFDLFAGKNKTGIFLTGTEKIIQNKEFPGFYYTSLEFAFRVTSAKKALPPNDIILGKITLNKYKLLPMQISHFDSDTFETACTLKKEIQAYFA